MNESVAKPRPSDPRKVLSILGWICVAIGAPMLLWGGWYLIQAFASASWPTVTGKVKTVRVHRDSTGSGHTRTITYRYSVVYAYDVSGKTYTSDKLEMGSGNTAGRESTRSEAFAAGRGRFPVGQAVTVYYDPDDPAMALLEPGASFGSWGVYMPVVLGLCFSLAGAWVLWKAKSMPEPTRVSA